MVIRKGSVEAASYAHGRVRIKCRGCVDGSDLSARVVEGSFCARAAPRSNIRAAWLWYAHSHSHHFHYKVCVFILYIRYSICTFLIKMCRLSLTLALTVILTLVLLRSPNSN